MKVWMSSRKNNHCSLVSHNRFPVTHFQGKSLKIVQQVLQPLTAHYNPSPVLHNGMICAGSPQTSHKKPQEEVGNKKNNKDTYFQVSPLPPTALSEALLWCYQYRLPFQQHHKTRKLSTQEAGTLKTTHVCWKGNPESLL